MLRTVTSASKRRTISTTRRRAGRGVRARCAARARCSPPVASPPPRWNGGNRRFDAEQPGLDVAGLGRFGGHLCQRCTGRGEGDRGDQPFDDGSVGEHHWAIGGRTAELERQLGAEDGAEIHQDERRHRPGAVDGLLDPGASVPSTCRRGRRRPRSAAVRTTFCASSTAASANRRLWETTTIRRSRSGPQEPNTAAAASNSRADDVAPGSW